MTLDYFELLRSEKELDSFGFYSDVRMEIAEKFTLGLRVLFNLETEKMAREQLVKLNSKNAIKKACDALSVDLKFMSQIHYPAKKIYKRFLFVTEPFVRQFNEVYLRKRDYVASIVGQNKTYVFEKTRNFQQMMITLDKTYINNFLKYKDKIAVVYEKLPRDTRMRTLNLMLSKELYFMNFDEEKMNDIFREVSTQKIEKKIHRLIQK